MTPDNDHNPDPNVNAARIVGEATSSQPAAADSMEAAWQAWLPHI